uniref:Small ribosomal subunit protein uS11m n=2 Tax=Scolopacidae TaxID=8917 RepID=A0A8C3JX29_9CHAR
MLLPRRAAQHAPRGPGGAGHGRRRSSSFPSCLAATSGGRATGAAMTAGSGTGPLKSECLITLVLLLSPLILQRSSMRWDGKVYEEIPIAHIKATYNNTHIQVVSFDNRPFARTSCGTEGFQNAKKGTAIAAQTAAMAAAVKARGKGVLHVRVMVKGLGPGRKAAIKGLTMGGLEIISITDNTPVPHNGCRPRKARRM